MIRWCDYRSSRTSVDDVVLMAPVNGFDQLVDVRADLVRWSSVRHVLQQLQHVLQHTQSSSAATPEERRLKISASPSHLLHILKHQVEFPPPPKRLLQLHDVLLLQRPEHLQLPHGGFLHLLIFWSHGKNNMQTLKL